MSETLANTPDQLRVDELSFSMQLELDVKDREIILELERYPEGAERDEYALEALKVGVVALRHAAGAFDTEFIKRETSRLLETLDQQLEGHARLVQNKLTTSLANYFDPNSGKFTERVQSLTGDDGELARLMKRQVEGENSHLAKTMLAHVGQNSPLMKVLSPDQSKGILANLQQKLEEELSKQSSKLDRDFSLDNPEGALSRLIDQITKKHGDFTENMQEKIEEVKKEFSLKDEKSSLSVLVAKVKTAQETITGEFKLDNEESALYKMRKDLTDVFEQQRKVNAEFQEEVKIALQKLVTKREVESRGTQHGGTFQDAVFEFVAHDAQCRGEFAEDTGNKTGQIKNCKVGDVIVEMNPESVAAGARITIEAKEDSSYTLAKALEEIEIARKNRASQIGIFVFSKLTAPTQLSPLTRYGENIVLIWDAEDPTTDSFFKAALEIARALCVRTQNAESQNIDFTLLDRSFLDIEKRVGNLDQIRKLAQTVQSNGQKIVDRVDIDQRELDKQLIVLQESIREFKSFHEATSQARD